MHIMLTNDDGFGAPGLQALIDEAVRRGHRVSVCAPDGERSAASHSITLRRGIGVKRMHMTGAETALAADGTPADCARLGLYLIRDVDMVISGINNGSNMGGACIYSGTVAAATEASQSGAPALAVSVLGRDHEDLAATAHIALNVAEWMRKHPLPRGEIYNLNVPCLPLGEIRGVKAADLAMSYMDDPYYREIETPEGTLYAYGHGVDSVPGVAPDSDVAVTEDGWAALSIISWNLQSRLAAPDTRHIPFP
ncbi:MAG: 5'/3'-nucleotidase SurE [Clostridiales bacterium]|nr:5'/3'-nucleotidase SurE [Clostridiales bacterium]